MSSQRLCHALMAVCLALLCRGTLLAQSDLGSILGTIKDSSGAVVPNAQVSIVKEDTNFKRSMPTNGSGDYEFTLVYPGSYTVSAEVTGFKKYLQAHVVLTAHQILRVDISLEVGQTAQTVNVAGVATPVNSESPTIVEGWAPAQLKNFYVPLPMFRYTSEFIGNYSLESIGTGAAWYKLNGGRTTQMRVVQDGRVAYHYYGITMPVVQEMKMTTVSANAEYAMPGTISVTSKSGTNAFHADTEWIFSDPYLNSLGPNLTPRTPAYGSYNSSFVGGGPVIIPKVYNGRNRTWFIVTYERSKPTINNYLGLENVPTVLMRTGDFSQYKNAAGALIPIYDPLTGQPFPGNIIPANRISAVSANIRNLYPLPNVGSATSTVNNHSGGIPGNPGTLSDPVGHTFIHFSNYFFRADQKLSDRDTFNATYKKNNQVSRNDQGASVPQRLTGISYYDAINESAGYAFAETHIFSPAMVNEARFAYDNYFNPSQPETQGQVILQQLGITSPTGVSGPGYPEIAMTGFAGVGETSNYGALLEHRFTYLDNVTWQKGRHTFKWGGNYARFPMHITGWTGGNPFGTYNFTGRMTSGAGVVSGNSWADMLLGFPDTTVSFTPRAPILPFNYLFGAYIQDDWKVTPRLTINVGLRYDREGSPVDRSDEYYSFDQKTGALVFPDQKAMSLVSPLFNKNIPLELASAAGLPSNLMPVDKTDFRPRLGFAFRPFNNAKTVIRAAYGIYTTGKLGTMAAPSSRNYMAQGAAGIFLQTGGPFALAQTFTNQQPGGGQVGQPTLSFPNPVLTTPGVSASSYAIAFATPNYKDAYMQQWNVSVEREWWKTAFRVSYVGDKSTNLVWDRNINQVPASTTPFVISGCGVVAPLPNPTCRRKYYGFSTVTETDNGGTDTYNSLQMEFTRPMASGFQLHGGWIWAKDITDVQEVIYSGIDGVDPYNRAYNKGPDNLVPTHRALFDFTWMLPVGRGRHFLPSAHGIVNQALGGWTFSGQGIYKSGNPFSVDYTGGDPSGTGNTTGRADRIGSGRIANPTQNHWFDPSAFVAPPCGPPNPAYPSVACTPIGRFGNSGRNILWAPETNHTAVDQEIFAAHKDFPIYKERLNFRFSTYITNPFNRTWLLPPNANISNPSTVGIQAKYGGRSITFGGRLEF